MILAGGLGAASLAILATVYAAQYLGGLAPCPLCLYQRPPHWIAAGLCLASLLAAKPRTRAVLLASAGLSLLAGGAIAGFHVGVEQGWWPGLASCAATIDTGASLAELREALLSRLAARCDEIAWSLMGISMAGYNLMASLVLALGAALAARLIPNFIDNDP